MENIHIPVLCAEVLFFLHGRSIGTVYDGTCGGGGHAKAILRAHPEIMTYVAGDVDAYARERTRTGLAEFGDRVHVYDANFSHPPPGLFDVVLLDIGVSSFQLDIPDRGFSLYADGPLDMRMDQRKGRSAADIVNGANREELADIFWRYGEERHSRRLAEAIVSRREREPFLTTRDLAVCVESVISRRGKRHPATRVFQALRIAVNNELDVLQSAIPRLAQCLTEGGRLLIITFHSLEDRIVKQSFKQLAREGCWQIVTKKPIAATAEECCSNRRSRSAKLRVLERI